MRFPVLRQSATVAALCASTSCTPGQLSQPSGPPALEIRGTTLLSVGASGRLSAWQPSNGQLREVRATWTAEGDAISVTSDGLATALRRGQAIVRARYDEQTGTATVHVVTSVAGTWRGSITVVDCWQTIQTSPEPCQGRRGLIAPLVLTVSQSASADQFDNLRATAEVFTPPAVGSFIGAVDSTGFFFLDGYVERKSDSLGGAVKFRWQLEDGRLVPFTSDGRVEDTVDVQLSARIGSVLVLFNEIWRLSEMTRGL